MQEVKNMDALHKKGTCIVYVGAPWCGPCKILKPLIERAEKDTGVPVLHLSIDDDTASIVEGLGVGNVPTVIRFKDGERDDSFTGARPYDAIKVFFTA